MQKPELAVASPTPSPNADTRFFHLALGDYCRKAGKAPDVTRLSSAELSEIFLIANKLKFGEIAL